MHPTALPSKYGIGDFGNTSKDFIDFLDGTSTNVWQVLPLGLTSLDEFSPYSSPSSILGNRYLIDIEQLDGFDNKNYDVGNFSEEYVEYKKVYDFKDLVFKDLSQTINPDDEIYSNFLNEELIKQHITFLALKDLNQTVWTSWDNEYKEYSDKLFEKLLKDKDLEDEIKKLDGKKIIFTNGSRAHALNVTKRIGIDKLFDGVFDIRDCEFIPKPSKEPYKKLVENYKIEPQYWIFFEDIARNLKPAYELGMKTVWIKNDEPWAAKYSESVFIDYKTDSLTKFLKEINELR